MVTNGHLDAVVGSTVYDNAGDKVGKVEHIYLANDTGEPRWVSVKTGLLGSSSSLIPLAGAKHSLDRLDVVVGKDVISRAPHLGDDGGTNEQEEVALLQHYGLTLQNAGWGQYGRHAASADQSRGDIADGGPGTSLDGDDSTSGQREKQPNDGDATESVVRSEERLHVDTRTEQTGRARLRKYVVTEEQSVTVPVTHEEVRVVREPINDADATASIGEAEAEVVLHADRLVTGKETVPVERVSLAVNEVQNEETVVDSVRKERIDTEGVPDHSASDQ